MTKFKLRRELIENQLVREAQEEIAEYNYTKGKETNPISTTGNSKSQISISASGIIGVYYNANIAPSENCLLPSSKLTVVTAKKVDEVIMDSIEHVIKPYIDAEEIEVEVIEAQDFTIDDAMDLASAQIMYDYKGFLSGNLAKGLSEYDSPNEPFELSVVDMLQEKYLDELQPYDYFEELTKRYKKEIFINETNIIGAYCVKNRFSKPLKSKKVRKLKPILVIVTNGVVDSLTKSLYVEKIRNDLGFAIKIETISIKSLANAITTNESPSYDLVASDLIKDTYNLLSDLQGMARSIIMGDDQKGYVSEGVNLLLHYLPETISQTYDYLETTEQDIDLKLLMKKDGE